MDKCKVGETAPPFHVNCRSTKIPYFDDEFTKDEKRASRDENDEGYIPIPANIKYPEWKEKFVWDFSHNDSKIIETGGRRFNSENDWDMSKRNRIANDMYEEFRNIDKMSFVNRIAENTGFAAQVIENIYNYVFVEKHNLSDGYHRFPPDYEMAVSFNRLRGNKNYILPQDIILLKHERLERFLSMRYNMTYDDAHTLTSRKYNYGAVVDEYYLSQGWKL